MHDTNFDDVGNFHEKFALDNTTHQDTGQRSPMDPELLDFRLKFLKEELEEFETGMEEEDHEQMFDALLDLVYVAMGTAHLLGYPWQEGWDLVQRANMAKERAAADGSNSKRGTQWDVVKPPGWTPPAIGGLLERHGFDV
jgi:predicted HAD superfamily Cof-like phosphohydrolase